MPTTPSIFGTALGGSMRSASGGHDSSSDSGDEEVVDDYGFIVTKSQLAQQHAGKVPDVKTEERRRQKWIKMAADFDRYQSKKGAKIKRRCRKGIPNRMRGLVWQLLVDTKALLSANPGKYQALVAAELDTTNAEVIERDLGRTFPNHCYFKEVDSSGQQKLRNVLHAYAVFNPEVGYCQGMGFVAATLIIHMPNDEECFWTLVRMMTIYDMENLYKHGFPLLQEKFHTLWGLLHTHCPPLERHLKEQGIDLSFFTPDWFLTLFAYQFSPPLLLRIWDIFMCEGWKIVFRVGLALLQWEEPNLMQLDMEGLLPALKSLHQGKAADEVITRALKVDIKTVDLDKAAREYRETQAQKRRDQETKGHG
eukprot:TRINITY_DN1720_c0_g1_i1.p1 TRINITY_DN1720_c0_g1~~TRINITY_DN1720_c0_g1_i1.p1  ORF type:complete len:365 (+),score=90.15 TRINITY_DN1720_c0_g1_i1:132-1226(+)